VNPVFRIADNMFIKKRTKIIMLYFHMVKYSRYRQTLPSLDNIVEMAHRIVPERRAGFECHGRPLGC